MGAVYRARDTHLNRQVAIKVLHPELASKPDFADRFEHEAKLLSTLGSPRIASLLHVVRSDDVIAVVMEYVEGEDLNKFILREGKFPLEEGLAIFDDILEAITHSHGKGVIHRDLKPGNVVLDQEGRAKVTDFGIARTAGQNRQTKSGAVVGTYEYLSPEQIQGRAGDERSDIYSLGIILFELLTGKVPFDADSDFGIMRKQVESEPPLLSDLDSSLPQQVVDVVARCLKKEPQKRFQSVGEIGQALQGIPRSRAFASKVQAGSSTDHKTPSPAADESQQAAGRPSMLHALEARWHWATPKTVIIGVAAMLMLILATTISIAWKNGSDKPAGRPPSPQAASSALAEGASTDGSQSLVALAMERLNADYAFPNARGRVDAALESVLSARSKIARIEGLFAQAETYFRQNQLKTPAGKNAFEAIREILRAEPNNSRALRFLVRIASRYEDLGDGRVREAEKAGQSLTLKQTELSDAIDFYRNSLDVSWSESAHAKLGAAQSDLADTIQALDEANRQTEATKAPTPAPPQPKVDKPLPPPVPKRLQRLPFKGGVDSVRFAKGLMAVGLGTQGEPGQLVAYQVPEFREIWKTTTGLQAPLRIALSPDGEQLVAVNGDAEVYDPGGQNGRRPLDRFDSGFGGEYKDVAFIHWQGSHAWAAAERSTLHVFGLGIPKTQKYKRQSFEIRSLDVADSGRQVVVGGDEAVRLWSFNASSGDFKDAAASGDAVRVAINSAGRLVASGHKDGSIRLWRVDNGKMSPLVVKSLGANRPIQVLRLLPTGPLIASFKGGTKLSFFDPSRLDSPLATIQIDEGEIIDASISPDGGFAALATSRALEIWKLP